ncbi:helix-turn-helix domain-containing protein [Butyricicoccus faecihominis]|uniref:helix-turn-helix domain-containing protein n=1 Tax=Butyricicoccus faecihominis TaxID=1712515 RepID=UPI00247A4E83|nr:helix-turn-helix transcriptional regulator [Butyricicoccus faecihominis]MCQ5130833.1 helix-turn-helix domain-containing protein [Butyricicoccus faecihominis]
MIYDFGKRLKELRENKNLTQDQVGKRLELTGASISGYENNIAMPPLDILKRLALLYGVTTDYLLGLEDRKAVIVETKTAEQEKAIEEIIDIIKKAFIK